MLGIFYNVLGSFSAFHAVSFILYISLHATLFFFLLLHIVPFLKHLHHCLQNVIHFLQSVIRPAADPFLPSVYA
jgi:hypothetical protein